MAAQTTIDRFALREYLRAREEPDLFLGGMEGSRYPNANASPGSVILSLKTFSARFPLAGYATLRSFACGIRYRLLRINPLRGLLRRPGSEKLSGKRTAIITWQNGLLHFVSRACSLFGEVDETSPSLYLPE